MSIVEIADVLDYLELSTDDTFGNVATTHNGVERFVKNYTALNFEVANQSETLFWNDTTSLFLKQTPVISISLLAVGEREVMTIKNTNEFSTAIVNITSTGIVLTYNGATTVGDFTFANNTTVTALETAINAAGDGWSATATNALGGYLSSEILPLFGRSAINNRVVSIEVPDATSGIMKVDPDTGEITRIGGFKNVSDARFDPNFIEGVTYYQDGHYNDWINSGTIYVKYSAGYSTMPDDIQLAIMQLVSYLYGKLTNDEIGVKSLSIAGMSKLFEGIGTAELPNDILRTLNLYKQWRI